MSAMIIDGKVIAAKVRAEVKARAALVAARLGRPLGLDVVIVGDDPASHVYVRNKEKAAVEVGFRGALHTMPKGTTQADLIAKVRTLSLAADVDGILVQLPLPAHLDSVTVIEALDPLKDVDGLHATNTGLLWSGRPGLRPCTPLGSMRLLDESGCTIAGARAIVVGRSNLVGKPIAAMLLERHATVTVAHSRTADLGARVAEADIVVAAIGKLEMIRGSWIKDGATVIDVGINRRPDGKLGGDVETVAAAERARAITPVPGGVGPMTIALLLSNTIDAAELREARAATR